MPSLIILILAFIISVIPLILEGIQFFHPPKVKKATPIHIYFMISAVLIFIALLLMAKQ